MENADVFLGLQDFLERMRQPSASDFVKSIKRSSLIFDYLLFSFSRVGNFIVSFSNNAPDPERDSAAIQAFFANMEAAFRAHPLWSGCSEEELDSAGEGLEKYVMTKLFTRALPDDVKHDKQLSEKMALIQQFVRPENLDIETTFRNETSWLVSGGIRVSVVSFWQYDYLFYLFVSPHNLLLNASIASNENPPGADEFLPVLIYVTIKVRSVFCNVSRIGSEVQAQQKVEPLKESEGDNSLIEQKIGFQKDTNIVNDGPNRVSNQENIESNIP
ncbi:hypothetical protein PTKIN_Ptkin01aG0034000 [Pterospermum kingtungense]